MSRVGWIAVLLIGCGGARPEPTDRGAPSVSVVATWSDPGATHGSIDWTLDRAGQPRLIHFTPEGFDVVRFTRDAQLVSRATERITALTVCDDDGTRTELIEGVPWVDHTPEGWRFGQMTPSELITLCFPQGSLSVMYGSAGATPTSLAGYQSGVDPAWRLDFEDPAIGFDAVRIDGQMLAILWRGERQLALLVLDPFSGDVRASRVLAYDGYDPECGALVALPEGVGLVRCSEEPPEARVLRLSAALEPLGETTLSERRPRSVYVDAAGTEGPLRLIAWGEAPTALDTAVVMNVTTGAQSETLRLPAPSSALIQTSPREWLGAATTENGMVVYALQADALPVDD
ncbi:MAG: hypothetical protein AB7S26_02060 [Sandaracinaceae bacterium]